MLSFRFEVLKGFSIRMMFLLIPVIVHGQIIDDFSDGNFSENPQWIGDVSHFEVNSDRQLHLNSTGSDTSVLMTSSARIDNTEWNFWVRLSFNTSLNNHCRIYLAADSSDLVNSNSLYLQIGGSNDSVCVMEQTKSGLRNLYRFTGYKTSHTTNLLRFRILHEADDRWEMFIDTTGGQNYVHDGDFNYATNIHPEWFGVFCRYTSSNAIKFWFDDFYVGRIIYDTIKPSVQWVEIASDTSLKVTFTEQTEETEALNKDNYFLNSNGNPMLTSFAAGDHAVVELKWNTLLPDGIIDSLLVKNLADISGNRMNDTVVPVCFYKPQAYDVVINEILADPDPVAGLPPEEFIELYNRTDFPTDLKGWTIHFGNYYKSLPKVILPSKEFLILSKTTAYQKYGRCVPVFTSSSSLANEGAVLILKDEANRVIHTVSYELSWFQGSFKGEGGWSLELVDPENPCGCEDNWLPGRNEDGGTPGRVNSVVHENKDKLEPHLLHAYIADYLAIAVVFNEPMDSVLQLHLHKYQLIKENEITYPVQIQLVGPDYRKIFLTFQNQIDSNRIYELHIIDSLTDCAGNRADTTISVRVGYPGHIQPGDLIINELLSDPVGDGARYFEIYNNSDRIADLKELIAGTGKPDSVFLEDASPLCRETRLCFPGDYFVFTSDPVDIGNRYRAIYPDRVLKMEDFPSINSDSGNLLLASRSSYQIIDHFRYNKNLHYPLLTTTEGVSLERVSAEAPSDSPGSWHSASEPAGYGTPGYANSQQYKIGETESIISIEPEIFSPDNDGKDDIAGIIIREKDPSFSLNVNIFNMKGEMVKQISGNFYAGNESVFFWNGFNDNGQKCNVGIYIVYVEIIYPDGRVIHEKKSLVLTAKF